ncbi:precorrin-2 C(20)-methyltransferase [Fodinisporobacter ferrooxydans]|uniref:Precorrin-2 C(20)-methyltransferase n=1 Tax=Fodinisporobacter ferrooxydans TaxID=2901836 RepID=A0ABY4CK24_9BACL|nr:precorrin-2 C(20)-methyltransferase [Alicyclobacillaceae bacterium MYW30-H2]
MSNDSIGTLYGVGVGPGDPELITVKAYRTLKEAPVIAYPKKRMGGKSYALEIVELYINPSEKTMVGLVFPMTKDPAVLQEQWNKTVETIWEHLRQGLDVAFVTEGDPMLYSTFIHMNRTLKATYPEANIVSIPGISSVNGAASRLGIPLADGDEVVAIVPATDDLAQMRTAIETHDCVIFLKVAKVLDHMLQVLAELELTDQALVATKVTSKDEMVWRNVRELRGAELNYLTLMVVRK